MHHHPVELCTVFLISLSEGNLSRLWVWLNDPDPGTQGPRIFGAVVVVMLTLALGISCVRLLMNPSHAFTSLYQKSRDEWEVLKELIQKYKGAIILILIVGPIFFLIFDQGHRDRKSIALLDQISSWESSKIFFDALQKNYNARGPGGVCDVIDDGGRFRVRISHIYIYVGENQDIGYRAREKCLDDFALILRMAHGRIKEVDEILLDYYYQDSFGNVAKYVVSLKPDATVYHEIDREVLVRRAQALFNVINDSASGKAWKSVKKR